MTTFVAVSVFVVCLWFAVWVFRTLSDYGSLLLDIEKRLQALEAGNRTSDNLINGKGLSALGLKAKIAIGTKEIHESV